MTDFHFDKFRTIANDGNLSLLSDNALETAEKEISTRAASQPGDFPAEERNQETLNSLQGLLQEERAVREAAAAK